MIHKPTPPSEPTPASPDDTPPSTNPTDRASEIHLDGSVAPNPEAVEKAWRESVTAPERIREDNLTVFRKVSGLTSPSAIVGSAEGVTQFAGLYENGNGLLSVVARQALQGARSWNHPSDPGAGRASA
jgi:hypothetical protein